MILTNQHIKEQIELCDRYTIIKYQYKKEFEVKIVDDFTGETLIIDNDFISKKPLKIKEYLPLCSKIKNKLENGAYLYQLSSQ